MVISEVWSLRATQIRVKAAHTPADLGGCLERAGVSGDGADTGNLRPSLPWPGGASAGCPPVAFTRQPGRDRVPGDPAGPEPALPLTARLPHVRLLISRYTGYCSLAAAAAARRQPQTRSGQAGDVPADLPGPDLTASLA